MRRGGLVSKLKAFFGKKSVKIVLLCLVALLLFFAAWKVFSPAKTVSYQATEEEVRLSALLSKIEGVKEASVMIGEKDGEIASAVVVFQGEDGILIRTRLMEAAARALGLENKDVHVYPSNKNQ